MDTARKHYLLDSTTRRRRRLFYPYHWRENVSATYGVDEDILDPLGVASNFFPARTRRNVCGAWTQKPDAFVGAGKGRAANTITVTMHDKTVYTYTISDIKIYKNTADFKLH